MNGVGLFSAATGDRGLLLAVLGWYALLSAVLFLMYGWDKRAAENHQRRTPEMRLHLVALLGGWPGGLLGQRAFRHKTVKQPFQALFWVTVALNCAALGLIAWALA